MRKIEELRRAKEPDVLRMITFLRSTGIRFNAVLEAIRKSEGEWDGGEGNERMDERNGGRRNENGRVNERVNERLNGGMNDRRRNERLNGGRRNELNHMNEIDPLNERRNDEMNEIEPLNEVNNGRNERLNQSHSLNPLNPLNELNVRRQRNRFNGRMNQLRSENPMNSSNPSNELNNDPHPPHSMNSLSDSIEGVNGARPIDSLHPLNQRDFLTSNHSFNDAHPTEPIPNRDPSQIQIQIQIDSADSFNPYDSLLSDQQMDAIQPMWDGSIRGIPAVNSAVVERIHGENETELGRRFFALLEEALQEERFQRR